MSLLARVEVTAYYGQVELRDPHARDYPQWETGEEAVAALPQSVAVATRGDQQGKVVIEVWQNALEVEAPEVSEPLYDGELVVTDDKVVIGNTAGNEFHPVPVAPGRYRLTVFASPVRKPARVVYFLLRGPGASGGGTSRLSVKE